MPLVDHFLAEPITHLPARRPDSICRTSHVDMVTHADGTLELSGAAVDPSGSATCVAVVGSLRGRDLVSLDLTPSVEGSDGLIGLAVARGFRSAVDAICEPGTLPSVVLSELPVAALLSGYASLYTGEFPDPIPDDVLAGFPVDICSGWASPGSFMVHIRSKRQMPTPHGPVAPDFGGGDGGGGGGGGGGGENVWHAMPDLARGTMRRQRMIERHGSDVWAMFRDTYCRLDGVVAVLHEYTVEATLDPAGEVVTSCAATPRVLPWAECPEAAASAGRMMGRRVADLRAMVKDEMVGTSTCTHLNDLLSSLSQANRLVP